MRFTGIKEWLQHVLCIHDWEPVDGPSVSKGIENGIWVTYVGSTQRCKKCGRVETTTTRLPHGL